MRYEQIVAFHGHECPGLAMGYRMAQAGLDALAAVRAEDEELVAIVENDACGVDALQCLTGCTFGKGNLLFRDYGKQVFTLYCRTSRRGVRVVFHGRDVPDHIKEDRQTWKEWILSAPTESILSVASVSVPTPEPAQIRDSVECAVCGEGVMVSRARQFGQKTVCIPCYEAHPD